MKRSQSLSLAEPLRAAAELRTAAEPLVRYLRRTAHPHVTAIVTAARVELVESQTNVLFQFPGERRPASRRSIPPLTRA